ARTMLVASRSGAFPRVVAPGQELQVCKPVATAPIGSAYATDSGTSFAAPFVSGTLALLQQASGQPIDRCVQALMQAAEEGHPDPNPIPHRRWGFGPLNAERALELLQA